MKTRFFSYLVAGSLLYAACGNDNNSTPRARSTSSSNSALTSVINESGPTPDTPKFNDLDPKMVSSIDEVVTHYLYVKNSLVRDNGSEAAAGGQAIVDALNKVEYFGLNANQMQFFTKISQSLKETAERTASNPGNIARQRELFALISENMYELVKTFGVNHALYLDHCAMANENKGANWLSEYEEIGNPYMGNKMSRCGVVKSVLKK